DRRTESIGRTQERPDVPRVGDPPEREHDVARSRRQVSSPVDADHARRMTKRRHLAEEFRHHVVAGNEQLDRLDPGRLRRLDEVLALDREETRLGSVLAPREKLPDEPELLVLARLDQAASASAALARSATAANAWGSLTAMSASDLRSSSIPALRTPSMKRL